MYLNGNLPEPPKKTTFPGNYCNRASLKGALRVIIPFLALAIAPGIFKFIGGCGNIVL